MTNPTVHGVLKARILKWGLPFPSPVDHILSGLSTMTRPSWVALQAWRPGGATQGAVAEQAQEGLEELSQLEGQELRG